MKVLIRKLAARLQRLSPPAITTVGVCGVVALGIADRYCRDPLSFMLFYMLVVVFVGWGAGKWQAVGVAALVIVTAAMVQSGVSTGIVAPGWVVGCNRLMRFLVFSLTGWLTAEVTRLTRHLGRLVDERTAQWKTEVEQHQATSTRLAEALERFEQVINSIAEVFWLTDPAKNQVAYISPGYEHIWGRKCAELYREPKSWLAAVHPADRDDVRRRSQTEQAAGGYDLEYRIIRPDGAVRWIRDRAFPVRNEQGEVYRIAGIADDITERKQTREVLQTQAAILDNMAEGVIVTDEQGRIVQVNPAGEQIWGYPREEVIGQPASFLSALPEPEAAVVMQEVLAALQATGSWRGTFQNRRKDGAIIFCEAVIRRLEIQGRVLMVAVQEDVTERLRVQEQLQMQARVLESMAEAALMTDETGTIVLTNPALDALVGYGRGELTGRPMHVLSGVSLEAHARLFKANLEQIRGGGSATGQYLVRRKDGNIIEVETRSSGVRLNGHFHLVVVGQDITERKRAEEALRQSEETLRVFLDAVPEAAFLLNKDGAILTGNQALAHRLGLSKSDLAGKDVFALLPPNIAQPRKAMFDQVLRTRQPVRFEDSRGGRHFLNLESPVLDTAGNVTRVAVFALDITERKRDELVLRESEQTYRALVETTGTGYLILNEQGRVVDANAEYVRLSGHKTLQEILGRSVVEWTAPGQKEANAAAIEDCLRTGAVRNLEINYVTPDGQITSIEINGTVVPAKKGRTILALCRDITQRKQTEWALARQEALYRSILVTAMDGFFALDFTADPGGAIIEVNDAYCRLIGYSRQELLQMRMADLEALESPDEVTRHSAAIMALGAERFETRHRRKDGEEIQVEISVSKQAGAHGRVFGFLRDITERKRAQAALRDAHDRLELRVEERTAELQAANAALRESEARLRLALEASKAGTWFWDVTSNQSTWDERSYELYGFQPQERVTLETWSERVHSEDREGMLARVRTVMEAGGNDLWNEEFRVSHPLKGERWIAGLGRVERDPAGRAVRLVGINLDITERKALDRALREVYDQLEHRVQERTAELQAANAALRESEERYRSLVNNLNVGVYRNTPGPLGRFLHVNPALARMHGYESVEEFQKLRVSDLYQHPDERKEFVAELLRRGAVVNRELRLKKKDGTAIYAWVNAAVHRGPNGEVDWIDGTLDDITERKQAEQRLADALELNRTLISASTVGIAAYKAGGECVVVNDALARMTGGTLEQLRQQNFRRLESWRRDGLLAKAEATLETRQPQELERPSRTTFGRELVINARFTSFVSQGELHLLFMLTDATESRRAQEALRASEDRYRALAESSPDAIFILDRDIKVQYVNSTAAALWRHGAEELIGVTQAELFPPEVAQYHCKIVAEVFQTGQPVRRDEALAVPAGEQWTDIRFVPLHDAQHTVSAVMGVCRDITERKHAERQLAEALDLNQKMLAASAMGIAAYKTSGECVFANEALARIVGGSVSAVLDGNFRRLKSWQDSGELQLAETVLREGRAERGEFYTNTRFGKSIWLASQMAPFVSHNQPHLLIMILDITERKWAESLQQVQRDLGVRLSLTTDLNVALNELIDVATHIEAVDCGGILLLDPPTGELHLAVHRGVSAAFVKAASHFSAEAPQTRLVRAGQPVYMPYSSLPVLRSRAQEREGLRAYALIPLSHEGNIMGSLNLASRQVDEIPFQTRMVIESIAAQAAGVIARIRAEEALRQSETRLRAIITGAPILLFAVDQAGIIRFEDGQGIEALGATRGASVGRSVKEVYAHFPGLLENAQRALRGEAFESIVEAGPVTFDCWYSPARDKEGKPAGYISVATNVTERHRLERQILEISDREQARIGQDIHDGLCQHLVSLAFDANALYRDLSAEKRAEARTVRRIAHYLDEAITESRQLARGLFPVRLATGGLSPALEELAKHTSARFNLPCRFEAQGQVLVKDVTIATHLYRIAQEAIANAVKHARARNLCVRLRSQTHQLELRVEDDGVGFSPAKRKKATGLGLHIMDYRARAVGGTLRIAPRRRGGTIISCCVPRPKG